LIRTQLAIVGAGPAGLSAAIQAAQAGVQVSVFDENAAPGGQLIKQIHKFFGSREHKAGIRGIDIGKQLLEEAVELNVAIYLNTVVWGIFEKNVLGIYHHGSVAKVEPAKVILCTGASENVIPFEGWTLPGVMGAGAAQTMMNLHRVLPGKRVLMIGSGNVGLIVGYQLMQAGATVAAVIEADRKIGGYGVHANKLRRMGVPIYTSHTIKKAGGDGSVEYAVILAVDDRWDPIPGTEKEIEVDTLCVATGLSPLAELAWIAGCKFTYLLELGGHIPIHNPNMETTVKGLYAAGDLTGIEEASTAMEEGRLAGLDVAQSLGSLSEKEADPLREEIASRLRDLRSGPFGSFRQTAKDAILEKW
jgi:NADPH-dependent 2,4-dienoyl-CoA reductase/sulfur reductase-like enzyme